ncbi:unnamed protein product [Diatraea saccharalis]|uniref:Centriolar and ciliogenesis-associated protein HYLS1 C-terminal domain-containing protein n=1 Tax=Diatraea saccharalis TaxID=40085 RepID=A0A9P0G1U7_9NEOP|nr:unnamed protein product [Diatraea saccharalis]
MDTEYYEVTSELDPREILRYLNNLGINNISGEILKYFITDLKKLIKYDLQQKKEKSSLESKPEPCGPERLHSASTFSSRIRSKCQENISEVCGRVCHKRKTYTVRNIHSAPVLGLHRKENFSDKPLRRFCSCSRVEKKPDPVSKEIPPASSSNLIKVPKQPQKKKCDPVSLYHYYTALWAKYKPNVPGENDWSDLRWSVRQKMAGNAPKLTNKASILVIKK